MKKLMFICILSVMTVLTSVPAEAQTNDMTSYFANPEALDSEQETQGITGGDEVTTKLLGFRQEVVDKENGRLYSGISKSMMEVDKKEAYGTYTAYTTANVNARKRPNRKSKIIDVLPFNTAVQVYDYNDKWCCVKDYQLYIKKDYLSKEGNKYQDFDIPENSGFKSFMSYRAITSRTSQQFLMQDKYAYTGKYGIRQVDERYCIAVGTAFDADIGTYLDLILENGNVIPCIVADIKDPSHTQADNITTKASGCVAEFVVDAGMLSSKVKRYGDVSKCCKGWNSPVEVIRIYEKNIL